MTDRRRGKCGRRLRSGRRTGGKGAVLYRNSREIGARPRGAQERWSSARPRGGSRVSAAANPISSRSRGAARNPSDPRRFIGLGRAFAVGQRDTHGVAGRRRGARAPVRHRRACARQSATAGCLSRRLAGFASGDVASDEEVLQLIDRETLFGRGIGYVDAHLLAAARLTAGSKLWTRDRRLQVVAAQLGLAAALSQ